MLEFRKRVTVIAVDSERIVFDAHSNEAANLVRDGVAEVMELRRGIVASIRMTGKRTVIDARPGSMGIHREPLVSGGRVFQHRRTWDRELAA